MFRGAVGFVRQPVGGFVLLGAILPILLMAVMAMSGSVMAEDWSPLWTTAALSQPRAALAAASAGGKIFFAGGRIDGGGTASKVVDVYDTTTNTWSTTALSAARFALAAASADGKVFFGGGDLSLAGNTTNVVDIYDTVTNSWSTAHLSMARLSTSAASAGGKVVFAGGYASGSVVDRVDIYDVAANTWTTATLSIAQSGPGAASAGGKILFGAGWISSYPYGAARAEIYDTATNTWSRASLSPARFAVGTASVDGKVLFAGGNMNGTASNTVNIYDSASGQWSTATLSQARMDLAAASVGHKAFFAAGEGSYPNYPLSNRVDIYDAATGTWSTAALSQARLGLAAASAGNKVLFAGGTTNYSDTSSYTSAIDVYTLQDYGTITSSKPWTLADQTTVAGRMQLDAGAGLDLGSYNLTVGSMSGAAPINLGSRLLTVGNDNANTNYAGVISGTGSLVKTGSGSLVLSAANTYSGHTTVGAGTLAINGSLASLVTVSNGSTLGGTGALLQATVNSGGHVAPGNSIGTLTVRDNLSLASGALLDFELGPPTASDQIATPYGTLVLNGQQFSDFTFTPREGFGPGTYTLIDSGKIQGGLGPNLSGTINGLPAKLAVVGNDVDLTVVPEPGTLALLATAGVAVAVCISRRRRTRMGQAILAVAGILLGTVSQTDAAPVLTFDGGSTTYNYGIEMSGYQEADDFRFTSPCLVTGARFWSIEGYGFREHAKPFDGHLDYWLYPSVNGRPGPTALATGVAQVVSRQSTGTKSRFWGTMEGFEYRFDLLSPFQAEANQPYFLALHLLSSYPSPTGEIYWASADGPIPGAPSWSRAAGTGVWSDNSQGVVGAYGAGHLAFQVYANPAPEPSTLALLGIGAVGLLTCIWRRRMATLLSFAARKTGVSARQGPSMIAG
jgi:autotransporter-associated beta strand protein